MAPKNFRVLLGPAAIGLLALVLGTGCGTAVVVIPLDEDGDGLLSSEEEELGTDPDEADSDGDDWSDGEEVAQGTDPMDDDDHPYTGGWAAGACKDDVEATGDAVGKITDNFQLSDQFGDLVALHDFCDRAVLLVGSAFW